MAVKRFEELIAWQKGQDLSVVIYSTFKGLKDYGFRDQICRASVSVSNNVAEGFDRNTNPEFIRFLYIAKASCSEVKSMLYLASRLSYIEKDDALKLIQDCEEVSKIIMGLINSLK